MTGRAVRSEGLLQLTYEDQQRYGCDFNWNADRTLKADDPARSILQPKNNLECGVKILDNQILDQHKPIFARTSYWSTLQPGTMSYRVFVKQMTNPPAACGLRSPARRVGPRTSRVPCGRQRHDKRVTRNSLFHFQRAISDRWRVLVLKQEEGFGLRLALFIAGDFGGYFFQQEFLDQALAACPAMSIKPPLMVRPAPRSEAG